MSVTSKRVARRLFVTATLITSGTGCSASGPSPATPTTIALSAASNHVRFPATIKGQPVMVIVDTGLNPSGIAFDKAKALALPVDESAKFPLGGIGDQEVFAFPSVIEDLAISGERFPRLEAVADPGPAFKNRSPDLYFDAILGYNFLQDRITFIDYLNGRFALLDDAASARGLTQGCSRRHTIPLEFEKGDTIPIIPDFQIGSVSGAVSLDTGASTSLILFKEALRPDFLESLPVVRAQTITGARGATSAQRVSLPFEIGFGPFRIAGQEGLVSKQPQAGSGRIANVGNQLFKALKLKVLLDYKAKQITFYGSCSA